METYFIEIVHNNEHKKMSGTRFLRCYVQADGEEEAKKKALDHYRPHYTGGENGEFRVQCCWTVNVPKREVFEKLWEEVTKSYFPKAVYGNDLSDVIGYRQIFLDETLKDVLSTWDACNAEWANPVVHYEPTKGGYVVMIHNHMNMPCDLKLFKGETKEVYEQALKWVEENTFKGEYYRPF